MREIEVRGKTLETGKWVYGSLIHKKTCVDNGMVEVYYKENDLEYFYIYQNNYCEEYPSNFILVDEETIGQYTGLKDRNGVKIFEGDIIKVGSYTWVVTFKNGSFEYGKYEDEYGISFDDNNCPIVSFEVEVIGNIYEQKELLEDE